MRQYSLRSFLVLAIVGVVGLAAIIALITNKVMSVLQAGLAESASIRVASADNACVASDDVHFVGCSSVL